MRRLWHTLTAVAMACASLAWAASGFAGTPTLSPLSSDAATAPVDEVAQAVPFL